MTTKVGAEKERDSDEEQEQEIPHIKLMDDTKGKPLVLLIRPDNKWKKM